MKGLKDLTVELDIPSDRMSEWTVQELEIAKSVTIPDDFLLVLTLQGASQQFIALTAMALPGDTALLIQEGPPERKYAKS